MSHDTIMFTLWFFASHYPVEVYTRKPSENCIFSIMDRDHDDKNNSNEQFCPTCAAYLPSNRSWAQHMRRNPECGAMIQTKGCDDRDLIFGDQPMPKSKQSNNSQSNQKLLNESLEPSENLKKCSKAIV